MLSFRLSLSIALAASTLSAVAEDWPQFRGLGSTGIATTSKVPSVPKIDWTADLPGRGLASPIVVAGKVFITCSSGPKHSIRPHL